MVGSKPETTRPAKTTPEALPREVVVTVDLNSPAENQDNSVDFGARRASNGKLTAELFEAAGVAVGVRSAPVVTSKVGVHQPSKVEVIRRGEEAMTRLAAGRSWDDWVAVMCVLDIARTTALSEANSNKPQGPRYREAIAKWFRLHPAFESIDKSDRSRLHKCFDNLDAINDWRKKHVSPQQLLKLNYPTQVFSRWESWKKKQAKMEEGGGNEPPPNPPPGPKLADVWPASSQKEKQEVLDAEGRSGLATIMSPKLLAEFRDCVIGQHVNSGAVPSSNLLVTLTRLLLQAVWASTPDAMSEAYAAFRAKCATNHLDPKELRLTFSKKRTRK